MVQAKIERGLMKVLFIITNLFVFMEEVSVLQDLNLDDSTLILTVNTDYNTDVTQIDFSTDLICAAKKYLITVTRCAFIQYVQFNDICNDHYDYIFSATHLQDHFADLLRNCDYENLVLVEDGTYDYQDEVPFHNDVVQAALAVYLFHPERESVRYRYAALHGISMNVEQQLLTLCYTVFPDVMQQLSTLPANTPIIFTSPLAEDFGILDHAKQLLKYLEEHYSGTSIILKKHPRDKSKYDSQNVNLIMCPSILPGQILDQMFDGLKLFEFQSTVIDFNTKGFVIVKPHMETI